MKKIYLIILLILLINLPTFSNTIEGGIEYDGIYIDYTKLNYNSWSNKADKFLELANKSTDKNDKNFLYSNAVGAYLILIKISPHDATNFAKIGHLYGKMNKQNYAKSYFDRGLNLDKDNPIVNYLYGEFYEDTEDYRNANKYYKIALANGYKNIDIYLKLARVNSKIGELTEALIYYKKAYELEKSEIINEKILKLKKTMGKSSS